MAFVKLHQAQTQTDTNKLPRTLSCRREGGYSAVKTQQYKSPCCHPLAKEASNKTAEERSLDTKELQMNHRALILHTTASRKQYLFCQLLDLSAQQ